MVISPTGAIVLSTLLNAAFLDGPFNLSIVVGTLIVVVSVLVWLLAPVLHLA